MNNYKENETNKNKKNNNNKNNKVDEIRRNSKEGKQNRPRIFSRDVNDITRTMLSSSPR
jgi:hypothetical protein